MTNRSIPNRVYFQASRSVSELQRDCPDLYVCQDFMRLDTCWQNENGGIPLFGVISLKSQHLPLSEIETNTEPLPEIKIMKKTNNLLRSVSPADVKYRINVKMALFSGIDIANSSSLESSDSPLNHMLHFLILKAVNKDQIFLVGGQYGLVSNLSDVSEDMLIGKLM